MASWTDGSIHGVKDWVRSAWKGGWNSIMPSSLLMEQSLCRSRPRCDKAVQLHGNKTKVLSDLSLLKLRKDSVRLIFTS